VVSALLNGHEAGCPPFACTGYLIADKDYAFPVAVVYRLAENGSMIIRTTRVSGGLTPAMPARRT